jgi:hypothetical protein
MLFLFSDSSAAVPDLKKQKGFELPDDSSAAPAPTEEKRVRFNPSVYIPQRSEMQPVTYPKDTPMDKLQKESRARMALSFPGTELNKMKTKAMTILIPGDPWYSSLSKASTEVPLDEIRSESIRRWQEYSLNRCSKDLRKCYTCFIILSKYSSFDQSTRIYYGALAQAALAFANAFDHLQEGSMSADQITKTLEECFADDPKAEQVRKNCFYAVEVKFRSELPFLSTRDGTKRWELNRLQKQKKTHPKLNNKECYSMPIIILGCVLACIAGHFFT